MTAPLVRGVGLPSLVAIALNGIVGSGILVLPATVAAILGPASPIAYLLTAIAVGLIVTCFAEVGSRFDATGGPYVYAKAAFGADVGTMAGWLFVISRITALAAIANAFAAYLAVWVPGVAEGGGRALAMLGLIGGLAAVNAVGVKPGARVVDVLTVGKLLPLLAFVIVGLGAIEPARLRIDAMPEWGRIHEAVLVLVFAFGGFEFATVPGSETRDPRRNLPIALLAAIAIATVLYLGIQVVALGTLDDLGGSSAPLSAAAEVFFGAAGTGIVTAGALLSTAGTQSATILVAPRVLWAMAVDGSVARPLSRLHARHRTPTIAITVFSSLGLGLAIATDFRAMAEVSAISRLLYYGTTCAALPVLRRRGPPAAFAPRAGPVFAVISLAFVGTILAASAPTRIAAVVGITLVAAGVGRWLRRGSAPTATHEQQR